MAQYWLSTGKLRRIGQYLHAQLVDVEQGGEGVVSFGGAETHARSVLKAISWRTLGTVDTFAITWLMTGRVEIAGSVAGVELGTKIAWYYLHERAWSAIRWGQRQT